MQENLKQVKRSNAFKIIAVSLLFVLFTVCFLLAVIAPVFTSDVAYAAPAPVVKNLEEQANSNWDLWELYSGNSFYGVFFNRKGIPSYSDCVSNSALFSDYGSTNTKRVKIVSTRTDISDTNGVYTRSFEFVPFVFTPSIAESLGVNITNSVFAISVCLKSALTTKPFRDFVLLIAENKSDFNNMKKSGLKSEFGFVLNFTDSVPYSMFDFSVVPANSTVGKYSDWKSRDLNFNSSFVGLFGNLLFLSLPSVGVPSDYVPKLDYDALKSQYDSLLNSMDFSTFNSVDLNSTKPLIQSTTMGNAIGSNTTTASYNGVSYGGYWYFRNSVEKDPYSLGLAQFDIGSTLLAGSDIKISYDALFPYNGTFADNVGIVLSFSNFGVYSTASNLKVASVFIPASDFISKEFIYNFDFDVNYITFGVGTFDSSSNSFNDITLGYDINSSTKQGVFISNFVVKGRGSNFNTVIDNANRQGYNKGYQEGKVAGREVGYQEGVSVQGDYSFMGLIGAVFDAPIQAFKGLLNFEILGVDMTAFVSSLFALAIIVVIIKIALGGK